MASWKPSVAAAAFSGGWTIEKLTSIQKNVLCGRPALAVRGFGRDVSAACETSGALENLVEKIDESDI